MALFSPMAAGNPASPTTSLTKTCRAGPSMALVTPNAMHAA